MNSNIKQKSIRLEIQKLMINYHNKIREKIFKTNKMNRINNFNNKKINNL